VQQHNFLDATLVILGHGSTKNDGSADTVNQHVASLRSRRCFAEVLPAFWKQEPQLQDVLRSIATERVFIVPMFVSEGYFSEVAIPTALGFRSSDQPQFERIRRTGGQTWFYSRPPGTHPRLTSVVLSRAEDVLAQFPFPRAPGLAEVSLFIAGHGTEQNENSRISVDRQVETIRALKRFADVQSVFIEEDPRIGDCFDMAVTRNIAMVPFFMADGLHVREDLPRLLGEPGRIVKERLLSGLPVWRNPTERRGKRVWLSASIGSDPSLSDVILQRVREIAQFPSS
jgi:sirohydrochlorin cobaltochelatase